MLYSTERIKPIARRPLLKRNRCLEGVLIMVGVVGDKVWHLQKKYKQAFSHANADLKHNRGNEVLLLLEDTGLPLPEDTCILAVTWEKRDKSAGGHHMLTHICVVPGLEWPRLRSAGLEKHMASRYLCERTRHTELKRASGSDWRPFLCSRFQTSAEAYKDSQSVAPLHSKTPMRQTSGQIF